MESEAGMVVVAVIVGTLVAVLLGVLVGALFLRWSVRILQGFSPGYGRAVLTVLAITVSGVVVSVLLMMGMAATGVLDLSSMATATPDPEALMAMAGTQAAMSLGNMVIGLLLTALFVNLLIRQPDGRAIGYGRSLLIALLYLMMTFALLIVLAILLALVIGVGAGIAAAA